MAFSPQHPYASFLHKVAKPSRYVGGEYNSVVKPEARIRMCLAFPDVYDIGMSHLGSKILYKQVNDQPDLAMERIYAPWPDMESELRTRGLPLLSLETALPLSEFDVVGFSLQYEMTYTNVLTILDLGGVPLRANERNDGDPLVIGGGPTTTHPEPIAPFFDAFLIGEGEQALIEMLNLIAEHREANQPRRDTLVALAGLGCVYVPELYDLTIDDKGGFQVVGAPLFDGVPKIIQRTFVPEIDVFPFPTNSPEPVAEAIFDRTSIEISRGCTEGCRFCQASWIYRPLRERHPEQIAKAINGSLAATGCDEVSLTSLSTADYSCISPLVKRLMEELRKRKTSLSMSSLRAYGIDEALLDELASVRATGLTFAPEAGTQRLRDVINKNITTDDILSTCQRVFSRGWSRVKLYFMIGLPTETDDDVEQIAEVSRRVLEIGRQNRRNASVNVSVSCFVPKPHTPFQWCAMETPENLERKQRRLWQLCRKYGLVFRKHDVVMSFLEGILARADRRAADLVELAWRNGARFDGWDEWLNWPSWQTALDQWEQTQKVDRRDFVSAIPLEASLPWRHIDVGLAQGFLAKEYEKALKARPSPPCGKPVGAKAHHKSLEAHEADKQKLVCYQCGLDCDMDKIRARRAQFLTALGATTEPSAKGSTDHEQAHARFARGKAPHDFDAGEDISCRIRFTKLGQLSLQGQLDIVRIFPRIFRRAEIELVYSEGFHPRPLISYGPALALGVPSLAEYAEVRLVRAVDPETLMQRLNAVTPPGLRMTQIGVVEERMAKLSQALLVQDLLVTVSQSWLEQHGGAERPQDVLQRCCRGALSQEVIEIERLHKRKRKVIDLRPALVDVQVVSAGQWPDELEIDARWGVMVRTKVWRERGPIPRPSELSRVVLGDDISPTRMARIAVGRFNGQDELLSPFAM